MLIVVPITSTRRQIMSWIRIDPPEGGLKLPSSIVCEQIRAVSVERLIARWGPVDIATARKVIAAVNRLLTLEPVRFRPDGDS